MSYYIFLIFTHKKQGWLQNFKKRNNINQKTIQGESAGVDLSVLENGRTKLKTITAKYNVNDRYNLDELALFFRLPPNKTLSNKKSVNGVKLSKARVSVALCANQSGTDKCKPMVIHKYERPRCFGKVWNPNSVVHYYYNSKAWMTQLVFHDWLRKFNHRMFLENRTVLLLIDNAAGHGSIDTSKYPNIEIEFLPANTTSHLQPMDAGIIRNFKLYYKKFLIRDLIQKLENKKELEMPTVYEAIKFIKSAWDSVSTTTIQNCWQHCRITGALQTINDETEELPNLSNEITNWRSVL